ncbi:MAG: transcription initiation factor IIB [Candidatus Hadarchaeales archaeon]
MTAEQEEMEEKPKKKTSCPNCGSVKLVRDYEHGELVCAGCGYVIAERIMDLGPEWRAFDQEQRDKRGRVGAPMTFSVDYSEPIILEKEGKVMILPIGEWVDSVLEESEEVRREGEVEMAPVRGYRTVVFDEDYKMKWAPISHVTRHPVSDPLYEVELEGGRKVRVTGAHSLYTVREGRVVPVEVEKLREGDFVAVPRVLPELGSFPRELNLAHEFARVQGRFFVDGIPAEVYEELRRRFDERKVKAWSKESKLPLEVFLELKGFVGNGVRIRAHGCRKGLPLRIPVDERLGALMGYYVSEGCVTSHGVSFTFGPEEEEYAEETIRYLREVLGLEASLYRYPSSLVVSVDSKTLALLLSEILGAGREARRKRVPPVIFSSPRARRAFLRSYVRGDGCVYIHPEEKPHWRPLVHLYTVSCNGELSNDLLYLYLFEGIFASYTEEEVPSHRLSTGQVLPASKLTGTRVTNPDMVHQLGFVEGFRPRARKGTLTDLLPAPLKYRREWGSRRRLRIGRELALRIAEKYGDQELAKLAKGQLAFLRVRRISRVRSTNGYAYDVTVPGYLNFVGGRGAVCLRDTIHDKGLSTMIDWRDRDSYGKDLTPKRRAQIYRLRKWQRRIRVSDAIERNLAFALSEIDRMASHLGLPRNVRETAAVIYRRAVEEKLIRGRSIEGVAGAALYAACRECKVPRTLDEIAEVSRVSKKEISRSYRFIARELLIHLHPTSPADYVPRFASELGLSGEVQSKAIEILKEAMEKGLTSGRGPTGVTAAAIYIAAQMLGERRTQREVADVARVTEVTVRNRYKELCEKLGLNCEKLG